MIATCRRCSWNVRQRFNGVNIVQTILRRPVVESVTGLTRSSIYAAMAAGTFPKPIKLGSKAVGWVGSEIEIWISERIAEREVRGDLTAPTQRTPLNATSHRFRISGGRPDERCGRSRSATALAAIAQSAQENRERVCRALKRLARIPDVRGAPAPICSRSLLANRINCRGR